MIPTGHRLWCRRNNTGARYTSLSAAQTGAGATARHPFVSRHSRLLSATLYGQRVTSGPTTPRSWVCSYTFSPLHHRHRKRTVPRPLPRAGNARCLRPSGAGRGLLTEAAPREDVDAFTDLPSLLAETRADCSVAVEDLYKKKTSAASRRGTSGKDDDWVHLSQGMGKEVLTTIFVPRVRGKADNLLGGTW